jgi:DNA-binding response OmpR family regulator
VIFLDIHLPRISGHEVLRCLKGNEQLRSIPVVMLSTSDRADDVSASYRAGANSYVPKPVSFAEFSARIKALKDYWLFTNAVPPR